MTKVFFAAIIFSIMHVQMAAAFVMTPLPNGAKFTNINVSVTGSCAMNDCTEARISQPSALPDPSPSSLEPSAGTNADFCRDVNLGTHSDLCKTDRKNHKWR